MSDADRFRRAVAAALSAARRRIAERLRARRTIRATSSTAIVLGATARSRRSAPRQSRSRAAAALERGGARRASRSIAWSDAAYPPLLAAIVDPPPVLWVRGATSALRSRRRSRSSDRARGSPYALAVAERLAADLAARGVVVVSGLARGVDSAAHRGALAAAGIDDRRARVRAPTSSIPAEHERSRGEIVAARRARQRARAGDAAAAALLSRCATASSAACRARSSSSRRARRAGRSSRRAARSSRGATCWPCPATS